jgi:hypothetical protein
VPRIVAIVRWVVVWSRVRRHQWRVGAMRRRVRARVRVAVWGWVSSRVVGWGRVAARSVRGVVAV